MSFATGERGMAVPQDKVGALRRALDALYLASGVLAGLFLIAVAALMLVLSVGREVGFNLRGGDDLTAWSCAASAFLGLAHTFKRGELIRVGLLIERIEGAPRRLLEIAALTVGAVVIGYFAWFACVLVLDSYLFNERAQGSLNVPLWLPQLGFAAGMLVLFLAFLDELVRVLLRQTPSYVQPPIATTEDLLERVSSGL